MKQSLSDLVPPTPPPSLGRSTEHSPQEVPRATREAGVHLEAAEIDVYLHAIRGPSLGTRNSGSDSDFTISPH